MSAKDQRYWTQRIPRWLLSILINIWLPYLGTGIHVRSISKDFRRVDVSMKMHWYNKNMVGTHFGGSLYAMTDPFFMLILMKNLGRNYIVWDKAATIEFIKPATGKVEAVFEFSEAEIEAIKQQADQQGKWIFDRAVEIRNAEGIVVARVVKTMYVRSKLFKLQQP